MASYVARRRFLATLLGGAVAAWPLAARAQQARKVPRVGLLSTFSPSDAMPWHQAFRQGLRELGWVEGENISIEYRYAEARLDRLPDLATDLVRLNVDLIFTDTPSPAFAGRNATRTIPIVIASGSDLVASGLAESLARPGGNITGLDQILRSSVENGWSCSRKPFPSSLVWWCCGTLRTRPPRGIGTNCKTPHGSWGLRFTRWRYAAPTSSIKHSRS
jgi:hypothetical protein